MINSTVVVNFTTKRSTLLYWWTSPSNDQLYCSGELHHQTINSTVVVNLTTKRSTPPPVVAVNSRNVWTLQKRISPFPCKYLPTLRGKGFSSAQQQKTREEAMYTHCTTADVATSQILAVLSADTVSICRLSGLTHTCQSDRQTDRQTDTVLLTDTQH